MVKQRTLFPEDDIRKKMDTRVVKKKFKKLISKDEEVKLSEQSKKPKKEIYKCQCGLKMHWKVAEGRADGCPQCNRRIPLSEIFEE